MTPLTLPQFARVHVREGYTNAEIFDMAQGRFPDVKMSNIDATRHAVRRKFPYLPTNRQAAAHRLRRIKAGETPAEHARMLLLRGHTNAEVMETVARQFPPPLHTQQFRQPDALRHAAAVPRCTDKRRCQSGGRHRTRYDTHAVRLRLARSRLHQCKSRSGH